MGRENHRGGGRGRGNGARGSNGQGRGRGRSRGTGTGGRGTPSKAPEMKFTPHGIGRDKQTVTFDTVKDHIIQAVQKSYKHGQDIAKSLRDEKMMDVRIHDPVRKLSTETQEDLRSIQQTGHDIMYQEELKIYLERKGLLEENLTKAYALIFSQYCNRTMQSRVEEHKDFDTTIRDDPIELLKKIRVLMHDPVRSKYPFASLTEAMSRMINLKQMENEQLLDYVKRFKQTRDIMSSHMGTDLLDKFVENTSAYKTETDDAKKTEMKSGAFNKWMAFLLIRNSDYTKYGKLLDGLVSQFSMGNNQYPDAIRTATDIMAAHKHDNSGARWNKNKTTKKDDDTPSTITTKSETSFAQNSKDKICYCCGKKGHMSPECPDKNKIEKKDWYVTRAALHMQKEGTENEERDDDTIASAKSNKSSKGGWTGSVSTLQVTKGRSMFNDGQIDNTIMKNNILLDSGSTLSIFGNPDLVQDIRTSSTMLEMATNGGTTLSNKVAQVPGFGQVWYNENAIANIFGLSDLKKKYRVTYDSAKEDAFIVHENGNEILKFNCTEDGLYIYEIPKSYREALVKHKSKGKNNLVSTVAENRKGYTLRQFERAKKARALYHIVGTPTVENFKALLKMNVIKNCPVTVEDVTMAEKIFGPDISNLKGKSTRKKVETVREDNIEIPKELIEQHREIELCMDTMYVNEVGMLTTIDRTVRFRSVVPITSRTNEEYYRALDQVLRHYNRAGFKIKTIHCDGEYRSMMENVSDNLDVEMNFTNAQDHVPEAERNNRTLKERIRAAFHRLPYKAIPKIMLRYLAMEQANKLNLFPVKGGISQYYSPRMIMNQTSLDYEKHCTVPFGAYVQANHETNTTNSQIQRTLDAIYLRPNNNQQGGHELMELNSGKLITRKRVKIIPVTDVVIKAVEAMADAQGFRELKFKNRHGKHFHDADWIEGVDYEESEHKDDDDEEAAYEYAEEEDEELQEDDEIDPNEIEELIIDEREQANPNQHQQDEQVEDENEGVLDAQDELDGTIVISDHDTESESQASEPRRSSRATRPVERLEPKLSGQTYAQGGILRKKKVTFKVDEMRQLEYCHNIIQQTRPTADEMREYDQDEGMLMARYIVDINTMTTIQGSAFAQQYLLDKGLKVFGKRGRGAASKEVDQLCKRSCFTPISIKEMTPLERKKAQMAIMFLTEKRDDSIKGRMVYNGKPTREWVNREDAASPTAALESIILTGVVEAHEKRDIMCVDIPNAFIQTLLPPIKDGNERVIMKITGPLVDMLVELNQALYAPYVVMEKGRKVLYVVVLRAIYGMLEAALLWYKKFRNELEGVGFKFNPYDPCVANRVVRKLQQTIVFHVDDLKSSHKDPKVNDEFVIWLNKKYGEHGAVAVHRGKIHDYLGMELEYTNNGELIIGMVKYVEKMIETFPIKLASKDIALTPAGDNLFDEGQGKKLAQSRAEEFHTMVAKGLFLCKRARPDIQQTIAILATRVKGPNESDWNKLVRMMKYLNGTRSERVTLSADSLHVIKWYVDASFAVHPDFKSHTGATMTMGRGAIQSISRKQKLNTRSSTEAELVAVDDASVMILWTKLFLEEQGYDIEKNILYQDNKSAILLEMNGKKSSGKRTRAINIRYFFVTDQVEKGNMSIEYCPTDEMTGDFHTKPLQGEKFRNFRSDVLGKTQEHREAPRVTREKRI